MLIVFDSKSSLTHYTFDKIKFLSQLTYLYCSTQYFISQNLCSKVDLLLMKIGFPWDHF